MRNFAVMILIFVLFDGLHDEEVSISDIKLVLPLNQETGLLWALLVDLKEIVTELLIPLVGEDEEARSIRGDRLDA